MSFKNKYNVNVIGFIYTSTEQFVKHHFTKFTRLAAVTILLKATGNVTEGNRT